MTNRFRTLTITYGNNFTPIVSAASNEGAVFIYNMDTTDTVYLTDFPNGGTNVDSVPLPPQTGYALDGSKDTYAFMQSPNTTAQVSLVPGGVSFQQPVSLNAIGGIKVFIQATTPTGTIPANSIWLKTSGGNVIAFNTWNGSAWISQTFNASGVLAIGTIIANLVAAGTVIAGIVDTTTISAATFKGTNWQEDSNGAVYYDPPTGNLFASTSSRTFNDSLGNHVTNGLTSYNYPLGVGVCLNGNTLQFLVLSGSTWATNAGISADTSGNITLNSNTNITGTLTITQGFTTGFAINSSAAPTCTATQCAIYTDANATAFAIETGSGLHAQLPVAQSDTGTNTLGNSTVAVPLTRTWNIPANDAFVSGTLGTIYEIETTVNGIVELASQIQFGIIIDGVFTDIAPITPGFAAGDNITGTIKLKIGITTTGVGGVCYQAIDGTIQDGTVTRTPSTSMTANGVRTAIGIDTTVTHNISIGAKFGAAVAGQTLSGFGSKYVRYGL